MTMCYSALLSADDTIASQWFQAPHRSSPYLLSEPSSDPWLGTWYFQGYQVRAQDNQSLTAEYITDTLLIEKLGDNYVLTFPDNPQAVAIAFTLKNGRLVEDYKFSGDSTYEEEFNRLELVDDEALFLFFSGDEFDDSSRREAMASAWGTCGFAVRSQDPELIPEWTGSYDFYAMGLAAQQGQAGGSKGYAKFSTEKFRTTLEDAGDGQYRVPAAAKGQDDFLYNLSDDKLSYSLDEDIGWRSSHSRAFFFRMPGGRLCFASVYAEFDARQEDDLVYCSWEGGYSGIADPQLLPVELEIDFSQALQNVIDTSMMVPGDKLQVPIILNNPSRGQAKGTVNVSLYLQQGGALMIQDKQRINIAPYSSQTIVCKATIPDTVLPGNYRWYVQVDATGIDNIQGNTVLEATAETEIAVKWLIGQLPGRKSTVKLKLAESSLGRVTGTLSGGGYAEVSLATLPADVNISLVGTGAKTVLKINPKGERSLVVGSIFSDGAMKAIIAPRTDLQGNIAINGTLEQLVMNDVLGSDYSPIGHSITFGEGEFPAKGVSFTFNRVHNLLLAPFAAIPIKSITVTEWIDDDETADIINAHWLSKLQVKGDRKAGIDGDFQADLAVDGVGVPHYILVGNVDIAGKLEGVHWSIASTGGSSVYTAIKKLAVGSRIKDTSIAVEGNVGVITTGAFDNAELLAGITELTGSVDDFGANEYSIGKVILYGDGMDYFSNQSQLAAWSIGNLKFPVIAPLGDGVIQFAEIGKMQNRPRDLVIYDVSQ